MILATLLFCCIRLLIPTLCMYVISYTEAPGTPYSYQVQSMILLVLSVRCAGHLRVMNPLRERAKKKNVASDKENAKPKI